MNIRRRKPKPGKTTINKLWLRVAGFRPAFAGTLVLTIAGGLYHEWRAGVVQIAGLERDVAHLAEQRSEMKADIAAETERLRRMVVRQCRDVCKP